MMHQRSISRFWIHILFWVISYIALSVFFSIHGRVEVALLINLIFLGIQSVVFYLNLMVLLPYLLEQKKYAWYALSVVVVILFSSWLIHVLQHELVFEEILQRVRPRMRAHPRGRLMRNGHLILQALSTFGILFLSTLFRSVDLRRRKEEDRMKMENKSLEAESTFLKSQLNPHFLFNALNNIYSISQLQSEKTPLYIHKLSELLRYVLYESNSPTVSLSKERTYLESYIELQLLKQEGLQVKSDFTSIDDHLQIAPLILIPFVENAFKHSNIQDAGKGWIEMEMKTEGNELCFKVGNSKPELPLSTDAVGGVGLENVKRRLDLAYAGRHSLLIEDKTADFTITLKITLDENEVHHR